MGLQTFKGEQSIKSEATVAKNYLKKHEIEELNLIVSAYLDLAELKAKRHILMYMSDWVKELTEFIEYQKLPKLIGAGSISQNNANKFAEEEYNKYKQKVYKELTQVEKDFLITIHQNYELLKNKKSKNNTIIIW